MLMSAHMARSSSHLAFFDLESIGIALSKQLHLGGKGGAGEGAVGEERKR
jgi:hypothetical protein